MYQKILVPLDGSELAEHVLEHAKTIAKGCKAREVILLQVIEPHLISFKADITSANNYRREEDEYEDSVSNYLDGVAQTLSKSGIEAKTAVAKITHGSAAGEILNFARENDIDLIIMSTHGKSASSRWHFGSVSDRVTSHSPIPVLIVAPSGFRKG